MADDPDAADVSRVLGGDISAFAGIVRRWQGPLLSLAYRFCRDRHLAEDMAQNAFVRVFRSLPSWRGDSAFSAWLFAVAANVFRSELRRLPPRSISWTVDAEQNRVAERAESTAEREALIQRAVASLPPRYRDVLVLFYFHEMNVEQTALSLGLPTGTVKARLHRGRELLRRRLQKSGLDLSR
jgi:RNA polymerase sigma-70 factor (ECF subfamily)